MQTLLSRSAIRVALLCLSSVSLAAEGAQAQSVIGTISASGFPGKGAFDNATQNTYIPTGTNAVGTSAVTVINKKNAVVQTITLPTNWPAVTAAINPITQRLYIGTESGGLYVVDPRTGRLIESVNVPAASVVVNQFTNRVYVSDFESNLYVIDGRTNNILKTIPIDAIQNLAVNPITDRIYAAQQFFPGQVTVINGATDSVITTVQAAGGLTFGVAVDLLTNTFYSADELGTVSVFDGRTNKLKSSIAIPGQPADIEVDATEKTVYVTSSSDNRVYVIDARTNKVKGGLSVGTTPQYITINPVHDFVYVGNTGATDANGDPKYSLSVIKEK